MPKNVAKNKELFYRQCILEKQLPVGYAQQVSWIPEPFCVTGKILKLKVDEVWDDGWKVISAGDKVPAKTVEYHERDYLRNRKNTDI